MRRLLAVEEDAFGPDAWPADLFRSYALSNPELFLVARAGRAIAGYAIAALSRGGAEIASIAVHSRYRRQHVASFLFRAIRRRVCRRGASAIWLMVRLDNEAAIRFYRGLGFARTGTTPGYYEDGSSAWRMRLPLD